MSRYLSLCVASLLLSVTHLGQTQNLSPIAPSVQASLLDARSSSSSSLEPPIPLTEAAMQAIPANGSSSTRPFSHLALAFEVGFLGLGGQIATPLHGRGNLRIAGDVFSYSYLFTTNGFPVDAKIKLRSVRLAYDFLPFRGSFHFSPAIVLYNGNSFAGTVTVSPQTVVTIDKVSYTSSPSDPIRGTPSATYHKVAPAFTVGWGNILPRAEHSRLSFPFEIGGIYAGQPKINLNLTGTACSIQGTNCLSIAADPNIQANIAAQQITYRNDYSWLRFYPIVQFGIGFKF